MDKIENKQNFESTTPASTKEMPLNDQAYVDMKIAKAQLSIAKIQNQKLKQTIEQKQEVIQEKDQIIYQLRKRLAQQQQKLQQDQWKISEMALSLEKTQKLLHELNNKKTGSSHAANFSKYSTPNLKKQKKLDISKIKYSQIYQDSSNLNSHRSVKTQYYSPSVYKSPHQGIFQKIQKNMKSPTGSNKYETESQKRYRIQKLMACNTLDDVIKFQRLID